MTDIWMNHEASKITLVFIHGWLGAPSIFNNQIKYFGNKVSIFAPDYFSNTALDSQEPLNEVIRNISNSLTKHCKNDVILIGHSMGGIIALSLLLESSVKGCIILDTTLPSSKEQQQKFLPFLKELQGESGAQVLKNFIREKLENPKIDDQIIAKQNEKNMLSLWKKVPPLCNKLLQDAVFFDSKQALAKVHVPLMYVASTPPSGNLSAITELNPKAIIAHLPCGHFSMLQDPDGLNTLIEGFYSDLQ